MKKFTTKAPGRLVPIEGGLHAFVPESLPATAKFPQRLWPLLAEAKSKVALLEGIGRTLPNPGILLHPLQDREAIQSSRLEGTYVTAKELLLFEMQPRDPKPGEDQVNDWREVFNYRKALQHGLESELPLSLRLIRDLHRILMTGVRGRDQTPGEFRKQQVGIGARRAPRFVPPPYPTTLECLNAFEKYLHASTSFDPLVDCFLCHYQFETIHPFADGNGRVGRLLLALMLQHHCSLSKPWLYLSEYFERHREEYCQRLFDVSARGDWDGWIEYCLRGTVIQSESTIQRCDRLRVIRDDFMQRLKDVGGSVRLTQIVEDLFVSPFVRVADLPQRLAITYPTAKSDLERLERVGIVSILPNVAPATYYAKEVFSIAYEDMDEDTI